MRLLVAGATGMIGSEVVAEARRRGSDVIAASRRPASGAGRRSLALDLAGSAPLPRIPSIDAVVLAVRPPAGHEGEIVAMTRRLLGALPASTRVLVVGGAGASQSPGDVSRLTLDDPSVVPERWRAVAAASVAQLRVCEEHPGLAWTYLAPPAVIDQAPRSGRYARGGAQMLIDEHGRSSIGVGDLATAVLDELERAEVSRRVTVLGWSAASPELT